MNNNIIEANAEDSYSLILKKILSQNTLKHKLGVFHMFEYTKPFIVHSELFLEYLRIHDKDFYDFLLKSHPTIKKRYSNNILYVIRRLYTPIKSLITKILYIAASIAITIILTFFSLIVMFKLLEFITKLLNGNLDNFYIFESPI
tara:strand:- start:163 stop:597 length:435 start_codon:yes stop_codon:yes gene_type:complete